MKADQRSKVVVDTNVWISAALSSSGSPALVVRWVLSKGLPVFSSRTFDELETRLWRPKFDRWLTVDQRKRLLHDLGAAAHWVEIDDATASQGFCRDPDDDAFLHAALGSRATCIVSGDADLLALAAHAPVPVWSPAEALQRWASGAR